MQILNCLIKKVSSIKNNPEKSPTTKVNEHIPCGYSMSTICKFDDIKNNHDVYRGKDCMEKFYESLKQHAMEIINFEQEKTLLLINKEIESCTSLENCRNCKRKFEDKCTDD